MLTMASGKPTMNLTGAYTGFQVTKIRTARNAFGEVAK